MKMQKKSSQQQNPQSISYKVIQLKPKQCSMPQRSQSNSKYSHQSQSQSYLQYSKHSLVHKYKSAIQKPQQVYYPNEIRRNESSIYSYARNPNNSRYFNQFSRSPTPSNQPVYQNEYNQYGGRLYNYYQKKFQQFPTPQPVAINSIAYNNISNVRSTNYPIQKSIYSQPQQYLVSSNQISRGNAYLIPQIPQVNRQAQNMVWKPQINGVSYPQKKQQQVLNIKRQFRQQHPLILSERQSNKQKQSNITTITPPNMSSLPRKQRDQFSEYENGYSDTFKKFKKGLIKENKIQYFMV